MLYPDLAQLKILANELCLDALAHAMHRDSGGTLANLEGAYVLGSELMQQKDELSRLVALAIWSIISRATQRILEVDPTMLGPVTEQTTTWASKFDQDPYDTFEWYFIEQMATCRNFDEPIMDAVYPGFPLDIVIQVRKDSEKDRQRLSRPARRSDPQVSRHEEVHAHPLATMDFCDQPNQRPRNQTRHRNFRLDRR